MQTPGILTWILPVHILAGTLTLVFGYLALFAAKGATLHRKSGVLFVCAMVAMSLTGALVAFVNASSVSVIPVLLPVAVMLYWLWRIRVRHTLVLKESQ